MVKLYMSAKTPYCKGNCRKYINTTCLLNSIFDNFAKNAKKSKYKLNVKLNVKFNIKH